MAINLITIRNIVTRILVVALAGGALLMPQVSRADLGARSLVLGSSLPLTVTTHTIDITTVTTANIGSILFQYCTTAQGACAVPAGLDTSAATLTAQNGATGFTIDDTTPGAPFITRSAVQINAGTALSYTLSNVTNPSSINTSFFIRVSTYTGTDGATGLVDGGESVVGVIVNGLTLTGTMPESLVFCVGTSGNDCTDITGSSIDFGSFSPTVTSTGTSVMAASTNAQSGYIITVNGTTLTSGTNTIPAMGGQSVGGSPAAASTNAGQFGLNLVSNTTPAVGAPETGAGSGTPKATFGTTNQFRFFSGDTVASSAGTSKSNTYTASYVVDVAGDQAAGVYSTTLTYICTATF